MRRSPLRAVRSAARCPDQRHRRDWTSGRPNPGRPPSHERESPAPAVPGLYATHSEPATNNPNVPSSRACSEVNRRGGRGSFIVTGETDTGEPAAGRAKNTPSAVEPAPAFGTIADGGADSRSHRAPRLGQFAGMSSVAAHRTRAIVLLTVATLVWGLSFPLIKSLGALQRTLVPGSGSWLVTACTVAPRFLLAGVVLALVGVVRQSGWPARRECLQGFGLALFAGLGLLLQVDGLQFTDASVSAFLTQLYAVLIPLWVALRTRRAPRPAIWAACALVVAGVGVLGRVDVRAFRLGRGEVETIAGSLFFMAQILWLERREFVGNRVLPTTVVMFLVLGAAFAAAAWALAPSPLALTALMLSPAWGSLTVVLTVACTLFCFVVMNAYQPRITATEAGLIYALEPVSASVLALFLPAILSRWTGIAYANEVLTWHLVVGGVLLTGANVLVQLPFVGKAAGASD